MTWWGLPVGEELVVQQGPDHIEPFVQGQKMNFILSEMTMK